MLPVLRCPITLCISAKGSRADGAYFWERGFWAKDKRCKSPLGVASLLAAIFMPREDTSLRGCQ